jgi:2-polyprenyl-3-methyl-5-hydroxy-6-metoxy-1,4-benzoquinol methylase
MLYWFSVNPSCSEILLLVEIGIPMLTNPAVEWISCPYCHANDPKPWVVENEFTAVKCNKCDLIYVNPRPSKSSVDVAVETGHHSDVPGGRNVVGRRNSRKVSTYRRVLGELFKDVWSSKRPISWLDIGAGFGEIVEAVSSLASEGSRVQGIEPMGPKAKNAQNRGIQVREGYLNSVKERFDFVSLIHVFSHLPDFRPFLAEIKTVLNEKGEFYLETGNIADLRDSSDVPTELNLPDHLIFAGEHHIVGYLEEAGFEVIEIVRVRQDTVVNLAKQVIRKIQGRQVALVIPYTSGYRALRIRARRP